MLLLAWILISLGQGSSADGPPNPSATISISKDQAMIQQPDCVQWCMLGNDLNVGGHESIVDALDCTNAQFNSCFCRAEVRSVASSYVSSCLTTDATSCTYPAEYRDAVSIYDRYCGFTGPDSVVVTTTAGNKNTDVNEPVTYTSTLSVSGPTIAGTTIEGPTVTVRTSTSSRLSSTSLPHVLAGMVACLLAASRRW